MDDLFIWVIWTAITLLIVWVIIRSAVKRAIVEAYIELRRGGLIKDD